MPTKPMLDDVELQHVQKVDAEDEQVLAQHGVPALEGDFLQDLGRRVTRVSSPDEMAELPERFSRAKLQGGEPAPESETRNS